MQLVKAISYFLLLACLAASCRNNDSGFFIKETTLFGENTARTASIGLGDIDKDGDIDILVANGRHWKEPNLVLVNTGSGVFASPIALTETGDPSYSTEVADFDLDGDLDIAVGNDRTPNIIHLNDGKGNFTPGASFGRTISNTRNITVADIDNDGDMDILIANRGQQNEICLNDGKGNFPTIMNFGTDDDSTIDVKVADMDGDGDNDLILANRDRQQNYIYLNNGSLNFSERVPFGLGNDDTRSVSIGDFNHDNILDIATANIRGPNVIYFGDEAQNYSTSVTFDEAKDATFSLTAEDLDADGNLDIIVANTRAPNSVFLNKNNGQVWEKVTLSKARYDTYDILTGDLNGDGILDIIESNSDAVNMYYIITRSESEQQNAIYKTPTYDPPQPINPTKLEEISGIYTSDDLPDNLFIGHQDSVLRARMADQDFSPLYPLGEDKFIYYKGDQANFTFDREKSSIHFQQAEIDIDLNKYSYYEQDLDQYTGVYEFVSSPADTILIKAIDDGLVVTANLQGRSTDYKVLPLEKNKFSGVGADLVFKNDRKTITITWLEAVIPFEYKRKN